MRKTLLASSLLLAGLALAQAPYQHVLLISVDGMHAADLSRFVATHPNSALAALSQKGLTYTSAYAPFPSDSFPGLLALVTGGTPKSTGVYYDDSYDRLLSPPGSKCEKAGTEAVFDESVDKNPDALDGGGGIDPAKLPLDKAKGCTPVYPHSFLRVNTVFEVAKAAGMSTAWSDKHPAYDLVNGPSGKGVNDLYTPEINNADSPTDSVAKTEAYDDLKVQAVLNQIGGKTSDGKAAKVPALFGMNFQAVSVGQKLAKNGYTDAKGTPSAGLMDALEHTDASLGKLVAALSANKLLDSTLVIVSAKHGQSPIDPALRRIVDSKLIPGLIEGVQKGLLAQATQDDVGLYWLADASKTAQVAAVLTANKDKAGIAQVWSGDEIQRRFGDPAKDSRVPDLVVIPQPGVIYAKPSASKIAEHGGIADDDAHVALLVSSPKLTAQTVSTKVETRQVAPSILQALGLMPAALQSVQQEPTQVLPGLF